MVYLLEFFVVGPNGERDRLDNLRCQASSVERAAEQAKTIGRNVKVRDRQPHLCIIRDHAGAICRELELEAVATGLRTTTLAWPDTKSASSLGGRRVGEDELGENPAPERQLRSASARAV